MSATAIRRRPGKVSKTLQSIRNRPHRKQLASTNPLERLSAEIEERTDVVVIFPNDPAIIRLVGALLLEQNDEWQLQRRFKMQLEGLTAVTDNQLH